MLERRKTKMHREPNGSYNADFDQFSKFLRGSAPRYSACNSEAGGLRPSAPQPTQPSDSTRSLAMVYAPIQKWRSIYDPEIALVNGTIFEELDKPFQMSGCTMNNGCRGANGGRMR